MREDISGLATLRRKRRRHPTMLSTRDGVEVIVPGLSTWTAEDLLVAGAWDDDLADLTDMDEQGVTMDFADPDDGSPY